MLNFSFSGEGVCVFQRLNPGPGTSQSALPVSPNSSTKAGHTHVL